MAFNIGDRVGFLHEPGVGFVTSIIDKKTIEVEVDGIEIPYSIDELIDLNEMKVHTVEPDAENLLMDKTIERKGTSKYQPHDHIDLHIENLLESHRGMSNGEILNKQITALKSYLEKVERARMKKVVIIHGVGQGVLKEEVRYFLKKYDHYEFMDAPYHKYGYGATELKIYYHYK